VSLEIYINLPEQTSSTVESAHSGEQLYAFLAHWNQYMVMAGSAFLVLGALIFLYHEFRVLRVKDYKDRYDYVYLNEVRFAWYVVLCLIIAAFFFANTILAQRVLQDVLWFYARVFVTVSITTMAYFEFHSMVRIHYPRQLNRRLNRIRNVPRISPQGNNMRKLSETEEDHYLEAEQVAEESGGVHSVDYDVWLDDKTGFKKIEKYWAYQHVEECSECGYFTFCIDGEEIERRPTPSEPGLLNKHFKCSYCGHREFREIVLACLVQK
jgi:hypothetical protein